MKLPKNIFTILNDSFSKKELAEIEGKLNSDFENKKKKIKGYSKEKHQLEKSFSSTEKETTTAIDFVVTFAEDKLSTNNFLEFLIILGETLISSSCYDDAKIIFNKLISVSKNNDKLNYLAADGYYFLGDIFSRQAEWDISLSFIRKAVSIYKKFNDRTGLAKCENLLGTIYGDLGKLKTSKNHFEKCLEYLGKKRNSDLRRKVLINLGIIENISGNPDSAYTNFNRALTAFPNNNSFYHAEIKHNLGMVYLKKENYDSALKEFDESIKISTNNNYLNILTISYSSKAYVYSQTGDYDLANAFSDKSMDISLSINDRLTIADNYKIKGIIFREKNKFDEAENYLLTGLRINKDFDNELNIAETELELAILYKKNNKVHLGKNYLNNALKYFKKTGTMNEIKNKYENY